MASSACISDQNDKSDDFDHLLTNYNPFQTLYDNLYESITDLSLLPIDTTETDDFIKLIVAFNGYTESTFKNEARRLNVTASSPNAVSANETCILISIPIESKNYNHYTISNIKFQSRYTWNSSELIAMICLFDNYLHIEDMECVYKSDKISTNPDKKEYSLEDIDIKVKSGQLYVFWLDVLKAEFYFGYSEHGIDGLREKYPLLTNMVMKNWRDKKNFSYDVTANVRKAKLFEIAFY